MLTNRAMRLWLLLIACAAIALTALVLRLAIR